VSAPAAVFEPPERRDSCRERPSDIPSIDGGWLGAREMAIARGSVLTMPSMKPSKME